MNKIIKPLIKTDTINICNDNGNNDIFILSDYLNEDIIGFNDIYLSNKRFLEINTKINYFFVSYSFFIKNKLYNIYGICIDKNIYNLLYIITDNEKTITKTYIELNTLDNLYQINFFKGYYSNTILDLLKTYINTLSSKNANLIIRKINNKKVVLIRLDLIDQQFWTIQEYYSNYDQQALFDYLNQLIINLNLSESFFIYQLKKYNHNHYIIDLFSGNNNKINYNNKINKIKKIYNINLYKALHLLFILGIDNFSIKLIKGTKLIIDSISYNKNFQLDNLFSDFDKFINIFKNIYCYLENNNQNFYNFPDIIYFDLINKFEFIIRYNFQNIYRSIYIPMFFLMILSAPINFE